MSKLPEIMWTPSFVGTSEFYDREDQERLRFDSLDEYLLETVADWGADAIEKALEDNETVTVFGFDHIRFPREECTFLDELFDNLDGSEIDITDPDGGGIAESIGPTKMAELRALERQFISELEKRVPLWACEIVEVVKVPFRVWWESLTNRDRSALKG